MLAAGTQRGARGGADTGTPWNRSLSQSDLVDQPSDISIRAERFDSADARRLIAALDASLSELYPPEQRFGPNLKAEHLEDGHGSSLWHAKVSGLSGAARSACSIPPPPRRSACMSSPVTVARGSGPGCGRVPASRDQPLSQRRL